MNFYIVLRVKGLGEIAELSGPYSSYEEAELFLDAMAELYLDSINTIDGTYVTIVQK